MREFLAEVAVAVRTLREAFTPEQVITPESQHYTVCIGRYWSAQQAATQPACFLLPRTAEEVALAITLLRDAKCHFVVRAGGHTPFAGGSSIVDGVVVDLVHLNQILVRESEGTVYLGAGCRWLDVYQKLEPLGLAVVGGRVAGVGVSGLILGGGISFLSNAYGWACDNVVSFEVATASGSIILADEHSNPDLFWALRGGGSNFGVVTRIELKTYRQGMMWGGDRYHPISSSSTLIDGLVDFGLKGVVTDPNASMILGFAWADQVGYFSSVSFSHMDPFPEGQHPTVFGDFFCLKDALGDSCSNKSISDLSLDLQSLSSPESDTHAGLAKKMRQSFWTFTTYLDSDLTRSILNIFLEEVNLLTAVKGVLPGVGLQVISVQVMGLMSQAGGNCLGLDKETRPLLLVNPSVRWEREEDDDLVLKTYGRMVERAQQEAGVRKLDHCFQYMNYASRSQDPLGNRGHKNMEKMVQVAKKYDPEGTFQRLASSGFMLTSWDRNRQG